jgi:chromate transporter
MYWDIFTCFAKVGAFTIGGGYAMIPIIEREVVDKRNWITAEDFTDVVAISQSAPGLLAVNISIFIGYRLKGVKGSIIASLGCIIAPFLIMLLIATVFTDFKDNPVVERIFKGIRPVVVAVILVPMINLAKRNKLNWKTGCIAAGSLALISFAHLSPVVLIATALTGAIVYTAFQLKKSK